MENKYLDANGVEINFSSEDFELVQSKEKIFDRAFETKPTTFIKDAFKRFCKNKSSVVATYIIGVIVLMSLIVPLLIPYDIDGTHTAESLLLPKVFKYLV